LKKLIIIPAYNESENIEKTVQMIKENAPGFDYVIINDCSTDNTKEICQQRGFNMISLPINLGIGGAVQTGFKYALQQDYDLTVQVDGDGQHDPSFLEEMAKVLEEKGCDMVIGSRFINKEGYQSSGLRRVGIKYFTALIRIITGIKITDPTSGLRMINQGIIQMFAENYPNDYPEPESIVAVLRQGKSVVEIPVVMMAREGGVSSISMKKSIYYMIKVTLAIIIERIRR